MNIFLQDCIDKQNNRETTGRVATIWEPALRPYPPCRRSPNPGGLCGTECTPAPRLRATHVATGGQKAATTECCSPVLLKMPRTMPLSSVSVCPVSCQPPSGSIPSAFVDSVQVCPDEALCNRESAISYWAFPKGRCGCDRLQLASLRRRNWRRAAQGRTKWPGRPACGAAQI